MSVIWAILGVLFVAFGGAAISVAKSDIQYIIAVGSFTVAAVAFTNAILTDHFGRVRKRWKTDGQSVASDPSGTGETEVVAALNAIKAELQWQRQQKEKEILRAKAALSTKK